MPIERDKIKSALETKGFQNDGGDHEFYFLYHKGKKFSVFTKISRGSGYKDYSDSLVGKVCKQLGLTKQEFLRLIECPLSHDEYIELLKQRKKIIVT